VGLAALAVTTLSACSGPGPGVAADVEGTQISVSEVDDFALLLCSLGGVPGGEAATTKSARQQALTLLIGNEIASGLVDADSVDPDAVEQVVAQNAQARETLPDDQVATFDAFVADFALAQLGLAQLGRESLEEQGQAAAEITDDVAVAEGQKIRAERTAEADIELDPRFGSLGDDGIVGPSSEQLSVPVSDVAVQGSASEPSATLGSLLPASQKCS
jgi:hypothetical protein